MAQLSQGCKPARPESRSIQDAHWALIEQCWSSIDQRPLAKDIVLSLENFLRSSPIPLPLCDFLSGIHPATSDVAMPSSSSTDSCSMSVDSGFEVSRQEPGPWRGLLTIFWRRPRVSPHPSRFPLLIIEWQ